MFLQAEDIDITSYSRRNVDRFAVLLDLWTAEAKFLEAKMKVRVGNSWLADAEPLFKECVYWR